MKKKIMSSVVLAAVIGGSATVFAAANPFSDVPADHWAYDAVSQLAQDGVIEGYGDGTYRGDRNITRYEMAQMVAKAMAKSDVSAKDKALIDKLAAEFSDELGNLGLRVAELEKHADKVKWTGELRYLYVNDRNEQANGRKTTDEVNRMELRLFPTAEINDHWKVKARLTGRANMQTDAEGNMALTYAYAEGKYGNLTANIGKMSNYSANDEGLVLDDFFSGVQLTYGKKLQGVLEAGRWDMSGANENINGAFNNNNTSDYYGLQLNYNEGKVFAGLGYRHFKSNGFRAITRGNGYFANYSNGNGEDAANIWSIGASYRFDKNFAISGAYANNTKADRYDKSGSVKLSYKGANRKNARSWGAHLAYRHISSFVSFAPTYESMFSENDRKGWELGIQYTPMTNILADVLYFKGKKLSSDRDSNTFFGRVRWYF